MDTTTATSIDATISSAASKGMGGGGLATVFGAITSNEMLAVIGTAIAILGFILNLYFQRRRDRREVELHRARLASLEAKMPNVTPET